MARDVAPYKMPFDLQPTLEGSLVRLRPLRPDDWEQLLAVASDPLIWEQHPQRERYKAEVFRDFFDTAIDSGGAFAVLDMQSAKMIGSTRYTAYDEENSEIEIGWTFLARQYWGGAYNREMKKLMLEHAFRFVDSVVFLVGPQNFRSQRAVEKIGGVREGMRANQARPDNVLFRIRREDWINRQ